MASKARRKTTVGTLGYPGGKVLCHVNKYAGSMRKHGGDRAEYTLRHTSHLDAIAHRHVAPMGIHGLVVRHKAAQ